MRGRLIAEEGFARGLILAFEKGEEWLIGRDPDQAGLVVADPLVSRRHAKVSATPEGLVIENLSATNPLLYNDEELTEPKVLTENALLKIGDSWFRFTMAEQEPSGEFVDEEEPYDTLFGRVERPEEGPKVDLTQTGRWLLKVISGPNTGAELNLQPDRAYLLGTDAATCDIVFHDLSVSRQHARIAVGEDEALVIEDLHSRNGVVVGGAVIEGSQTLQSNQVVALGTTSFVVIDREGVQETLISALPPPPVEQAAPVEEEGAVPEEAPKKKPILSGGAFILLLVALALVVTATAGTLALFKTEKVERAPRDYREEIQQTIANLPSIRYSFNPASGVLFIEGNVLSTVEKQQLLSNLGTLDFIVSIKDSVTVDQQVWEEQNALLESMGWKGITIYSSEPGRYVITGYLPSLKKSVELQNWLATNFPYLDKLDYQVVSEDLLSEQIATQLISSGFPNVTFVLADGEVVLNGYIGRGDAQKFDQVVQGLRKIRGVRTVRNFVIATGEHSALVDLSKRYPIRGFVQQDGVVTAIQIGDKIYEVGEQLDGLQIQSIDQERTILEKNGIRYQIRHHL